MDSPMSEKGGPSTSSTLSPLSARKMARNAANAAILYVREGGMGRLAAAGVVYNVELGPGIRQCEA